MLTKVKAFFKRLLGKGVNTQVAMVAEGYVYHDPFKPCGACGTKKPHVEWNGTHIWSCPECNEISLEANDQNDIMNLLDFFNRPWGSDPDMEEEDVINC